MSNLSAHTEQLLSKRKYDEIRSMSLTTDPSAPASEQLASRKNEEIEAEHRQRRSVRGSRADYNRYVGKLILEEKFAAEKSTTHTQIAKFEVEEIYFEMLLNRSRFEQ